jgi:hypothetical protein
MRESYAEHIAPVVKERWDQETTEKNGAANTKKPNAAFRSKIARELFAELPEEEREEIRGRAVAEAREAKEAYEKFMKTGPSKNPEDRQKYVFFLFELDETVSDLVIVCCSDVSIRSADSWRPFWRASRATQGFKGLLSSEGRCPSTMGRSARLSTYS